MGVGSGISKTFASCNTIHWFTLRNGFVVLGVPRYCFKPGGTAGFTTELLHRADITLASDRNPWRK